MNTESNFKNLGDGLFSEEEDLPVANHLLRILNEIFDVTDPLISNKHVSVTTLMNAKSQRQFAAQSESLDSEANFGRLIEIIAKLRVLKDKASKTVYTTPENSKYLLDLINDITTAFARADGYFPEYITMGKGGATCTPVGMPIDQDMSFACLSESNRVPPSAYSIMIKLRSGNRQEISDAVQAVLYICCGDGTIKNLNDDLGKASSRDLRAAGGLQMLLNALKRPRKDDWLDLEFQITKAVAMLVTFEAEDTQILLRNASEILTSFLSCLQTMTEYRLQHVRSRANSTTTLSSLEVFEKGWRKDELGKAVLIRHNSVDTSIAANSNTEQMRTDEEDIRFLVAKALARLSEVFAHEWKKMDQTTPILPPVSSDTSASFTGRISGISTASLARSDSGLSSAANTPQASGSTGVRRRSLSGAGQNKDAVMAETSRCLLIIVRNIIMICDDNGGSSDSVGSPFLHDISPLVSPLSSPRATFSDDFHKPAVNTTFDSASSTDPAVVLCCKALCSLAEVPICVPALVEGGRSLHLLKGLMDRCAIALRMHLQCAKLDAQLEGSQTSLLADFVCKAIVNMLDSRDIVSNDRYVQGRSAPLLGWMDQQILRAGLGNSIVIFVKSALDDFRVPDCIHVRSTLSMATERSLAHVLNQLCGHAYQRQQMLAMDTPYVFAALFVSAACRCQRDKCAPDCDFLEYMTRTCLDGLTFFLTDFAGEQPPDRRASEATPDQFIQQLSCKAFIESITYALSNLSQSRARLACLHVVSNLTEWPMSLEALVKGGIVEPLVLIAETHMKIANEFKSFSAESKANSKTYSEMLWPPGSSKPNLLDTCYVTSNVRQALSSYSLSNATTLADYANFDRGSVPSILDSDNSLRSLKANALGPHSISRDGINSSIKTSGLYATSANVIEESMTVCSSLANVAQHNYEYAARLYKNGVLSIMLKIAGNDNPEVKRQALRCVGAICPIIPSRALHNHSGHRLETSHFESSSKLPKPREALVWNDSVLHLEAARVRRTLSTTNGVDSNAAASQTLKVLWEALSSDNYMVQREAMYGIAGLALSEDESIKDQIFCGPLKLVCALMMDTNHEDELRTMAESVLINSGFKGGKDDYQICSDDFSRLQDWFNIRRWMEPQRLTYKLLFRWINILFPIGDIVLSSKSRESTAKANVISALSSPSGKVQTSASSVASGVRTGSFSPLFFESGSMHNPSKVNPPDLTTGTLLQYKTLVESFADLVGFGRKASIQEDEDTPSVTPWNLAPANYQAKHLSNSGAETLDRPPAGANAVQSLFFPSRIHQLFILDLLSLGCEEEVMSRNDFKLGYDSDSSTGTTGSGSSAMRRKEKRAGNRAFLLPRIHEIYAIGLPELHYHQITMTSLARVIERTISDCNAQAPDRLYALAFSNSSFAADFHETFLSCLHRLPQITALTFQENKPVGSGVGVSSPRQTGNNSLEYVGGNIPSSIRFLTFQGCLMGKQVQWLCGLLKRNNAAFKGHAENLHSMNDGDAYDSDGSTNSISTYYSGKDASSYKDRSRNGKEAKDGATRWKYTKGIVGLALTNITLGNDEVKQICKLLNLKGINALKTGSYSPAHNAFDEGNLDLEEEGISGRGLKYLDLSENNLSDDHFGKIILAASCGPLEGLELGGNNMKQCSSMLEALKHVMKNNNIATNRLRHLGFNSTMMSTKSVCLLLEALTKNETLTSVDISNNSLGSSAELEYSLKEFLESNQSLRTLDLSYNGFDAVIAAVLEFGLLSNLTLILLPFLGNLIDQTDNSWKEIQKSLARNRRYYTKAVHNHQEKTSHKEHIRWQMERLGTFKETNEAASSVPHQVDSKVMHLNAPDDVSSYNSSESLSPFSPITNSNTHASASALQKVPNGVHNGDSALLISSNVSRTGLPIDGRRIRVSECILQPDGSVGQTVYAEKFNISRNVLSLPGKSISEPAVIEESLSVLPVDNRQNGGDKASSGGKMSQRKNGQYLQSAAHNTLFVFFAAPLALRERGGTLHPAGLPLPYNVERDAIMQVFKEVQRDNNVSFGFATTDAVRSAVTMGCRALHISGHGHPSAVWFEDGLAGLQLVDKDSLHKLLSAGNAPTPDFVFISACHSESTAEAFLDLGVKHIVCVKVDVQILDSLAVVFTRAFYLALLSGNTVKHAFDIGKEALSASPYVRGGAKGAELESSKFILLPANKPHDEAIFSGKRSAKKWPSKPYHCAFVGSASSNASDGRNASFGMSSPGSKFVPAPPVDFVGREVDTYRVIRDISKQRLVTLVGIPGVGKSSLACAACTYMADRRLALLEDGVIFLKAKGITSYPKFLQALKQLLLDRNNNSIIRDRVRKLTQTLDESDDDERNEHVDINLSPDVNRLEKFVLGFFLPLRVLLVLDHIDDMLDMDELKVFLATLFQECPALKVLVVGTHTMRMLRLPNYGVAETTCGIENLTLKNTLRLFARMSPLLKTMQDKESFVRRMLGKQPHQLSMTMGSRGITLKSANIFKALGNGHPATILKLAHESTEAMFVELFKLAEDDEGGVSIKDRHITHVI